MANTKQSEWTKMENREVNGRVSGIKKCISSSSSSLSGDLLSAVSWPKLQGNKWKKIGKSNKKITHSDVEVH